MQTARQMLDHQFLEMRWRCLSLAADLDRIARAAGGPELLSTDPRLQRLSQALQLLAQPQSSLAEADRAESVQKLFSDQSPPPDRL